MPATIPTVAEIRDQIISDIESRIGSSVPILPKAFIRVLAIALAGVIALVYRFGRWVLKQIFPQTADEKYLLKIGDRYDVIRTPAVRAKLTATATGEEGTEIPAATLWIGKNNGLTYSQTEYAEIDSGSATVTVECLTAGADGNLENGETLQLASPIVGLDTEATVASAVTTGVDREDIEDYRSRVIQRMKNQPQGGAAPDYIKWAREVAGIVKAFAFRTAAGYVTIYPLQATTGLDRIPGTEKIQEVEDYCNSVARRPLCANVLAEAMTELEVDIEITGLSPGDAATKEQIETYINTWLYAAYPKQYTGEVNPTNKLSVGTIWAAIIAANAVATAVSMEVDSSPYTNYTLADDEIVKLGSLSWA